MDSLGKALHFHFGPQMGPNEKTPGKKKSSRAPPSLGVIEKPPSSTLPLPRSALPFFLCLEGASLAFEAARLPLLAFGDLLAVTVQSELLSSFTGMAEPRAVPTGMGHRATPNRGMEIRRAPWAHQAAGDSLLR